MRYIEACRNDEWCLRLWHRDKPQGAVTVPFRCRSWRHPGPCATWKFHQDYARVIEAVKSRRNWTYIVLTYDANNYKSIPALMRSAVVHWSRLRKRMVREYGTIAYIQTWEAHKSGYPHANLIVSNNALADQVDDIGHKRWLDIWSPKFDAVGFGYITWIERVRKDETIAGYMVKCSNEVTGATNKNQVPLDAPPHFRRLRASQGLLPPPFSNPYIRGVMHFCPADKLGLPHLTHKSRKKATKCKRKRLSKPLPRVLCHLTIQE